MIIIVMIIIIQLISSNTVSLLRDHEFGPDNLGWPSSGLRLDRTCSDLSGGTTCP